MSGLGDFAALDAIGADADALGGSVDESVNGLEVWVPATPGYVVRVRDVVAELRTFAANVAYLCHGSNSRIFLQSVIRAVLSGGTGEAVRTTLHPSLDARASYALGSLAQR